jgi:MSHA biogenesis protein MshJ
MKLPPQIESLFARFDRLTMRERVLICAALLTAVGMTWMIAIQDPLTSKERSLRGELTTIQESLDSNAATNGAESDPAVAALRKAKELQKQLDDINKELASKAAGLIPPERMVQVIHDVLAHQRGLTLVSLHNKPVMTLVSEVPAPEPATPEAADESASGAVSSEPAPPIESGPYVHPVEIVIEGRYLDILDYLRALEALPWHFYWKVLELNSGTYPSNRVRIELSTLSMDKEWLGV